mgnify:CR=1 FL=1
MNTYTGNHYAHSLFLRTLLFFEVLFISQDSLYFPRLSYFSRFSLNFRNPLLFPEILFLFIQFSLLSHHLFLLLALQELQQKQQAELARKQADLNEKKKNLGK